MEQHKTKYCPDCKSNKDINDFNPSKTSGDGTMDYCKPCQRIRYNNKYRGRHKHHPGYMREYMREYYHRNKEKWVYYTYNSEKARQYYLLNREILLNKSKKYSKENKAAGVNGKAKRRLKLCPAIPISLINDLIDDSNNICFWCGQDIPVGKMHLDHIYPISKGGEHNINNLVVSCASCNHRKHNKQPEVFLEEILKEKTF